MKKFVLMGCTLLSALVVMTSCKQEEAPYVEPEVDVEGYYAIATMSVPCGTQEVMVETFGLDANGNKTSVKYQKVPVKPVVATPTGGKAVEPFGEVTLLLNAPNKTMASVYYTISGTVQVKSDAYEDRTRQPKYVVENLPIDKPGKNVTTKAEMQIVYLPEPAEYESDALIKTVYQSSGVVMFEDSWPVLTGNINDEDYNDVVVDYDVTAEVVDDEQAKAGTEQVKVVLHVRAVSGKEPHRVGMILEGFDMDNVQTVEEYRTLDSYGSGHGELPSWTVGTLQENSLHYDSWEKTEYRCEEAVKRPCIEIGKIDILSNADRGAGTEVYTYTNNGIATEHVMNPALRKYGAWGDAHTDQYSADLPADLLAKAQNPSNNMFYNVNPGYVNVAGGLYTYTVIYKMKGRKVMGAAKSAEVKQNMMDAVTKTTSQNFYIIKSDYTPVGLKGYQPYDYKVKLKPGVQWNSDYLTKYTSVYNKNKNNLSATNYYEGKNGEVWGFKCPTLTKHVWNKLGFGLAYPHYEEWVKSNGETHANWYTEDVNLMYLTCWW